MADGPLRQLARPDLHDPVLIAAFRGWNDAGDAATFAASHLARVWDTEPIADIDPEDFYDFQAVRPQVELVDGLTRRITWPSNEFTAARLPGNPHDVIVLVGTEPNTRWRTFAGLISDLAASYGTSLVITFGALLADVPHSRPVQVTGTAVDRDLIERLGLQRSRYEGPTGIVGVLHDRLARDGISSASLWAAVPHYLSAPHNPKAALALVERAVQLVGAAADVDALHHASAVFDREIAEAVSDDDDVRNYVRLLEERADERLHEDAADVPSGDAIAAELERFLRERDGGDAG